MRNKLQIRFILIIITLLMCLVEVSAHKATRYTKKTQHFTLTIDAAKSSLLANYAELCETIYQQESKFFDFEIDKQIPILFLDEDDYANGYAYAAQGWVVIYLHSADLNFRGRFPWLPNVIAHEIAHIFTLRKMGVDSRFLGLQLFSYWDLSSSSGHGEELSIEFSSVPTWLAEGLAQYGSEHCGYDSLDNYRKMLLRVALKSKQLLTSKEMAGAAWNPRMGEQIYAQGFYAVHYLYEKFGREKMNLFMSTSAKLGYRKALAQVLSLDEQSLYQQWTKQANDSLVLTRLELKEPTNFLTKNWLEAGPDFVLQTKLANSRQGQVLLSSHANDYTLSSLYYRKNKQDWSKIAFHCENFFEVNSEGTKVIYIQSRKGVYKNSDHNDVFEYDLNTGFTRQLSQQARIIAAVYAGSEVYAIRDDRGKTRLIRLDERKLHSVDIESPEGGWRDLRTGQNAMHLFAVVSTNKEIIYNIDLEKKSVKPWINLDANVRDPFWHAGRLYFSSDLNGIFNIYSSDGNDLRQHTSVFGGAFQPTVEGEQLFYSYYGEKGFTIVTTSLDSISHSEVISSNLNYGEDGSDSTEKTSFENDSTGHLSNPISLNASTRPESNSQINSTDNSAEESLPGEDLKSPGTPIIHLKPIAPQDGLRYLGYALSLGIHGRSAGPIPLPVFYPDRDSVIDAQKGYRKGFQTVHTGTSLLWLHPGQESVMKIDLELAKETDFSRYQKPYLSIMNFLYQNQFSWGMFLFSAGYNAERFPRVELEETRYQTSDSVLQTLPYLIHPHLIVAGQSPITNYISSITSFQIDVTLWWDAETDQPYHNEPGGSFGFMQVLPIEYAEPGSDQILQGIQIVPVLGFVPFVNIGLAGIQLQGQTNIDRKLYFAAGFTGSLSSGPFSSSFYSTQTQIMMPVPLGLELGPKNGRRILLDKIYVYLGYQLETANLTEEIQNGFMFQQQKSLDIAQHLYHSALATESNTYTSNRASAGFAIRTLTLYDHVAFWNFSFFVRPQDASDWGWQATISL